MKKPIRVLIVDDSALVRQLLGRILEEHADFEVVDKAVDPFDAREKIKRHNPDVITLDVEMPRMDGITFLKNLMRLRPTPVVMVSSLTEKGAAVTLAALEEGAIDFVTKPKQDLAGSLESYADEIREKIRVASRATPRPRKSGGAAKSRLSSSSSTSSLGFRTTDQIIAIGASTGGTEAIREVITRLPVDSPGIVITQHIPAAFSQAFADRMDNLSAMTVRQASDGQQILKGHVFIAPGDKHLEVVRSGARFICKVYEGEPVNRHIPSVDVLFDSVAKNIGRNAVGVLLTGMGADGAEGLLKMRDAGATTIAQDEATSVVWGMPGAAVKINAAERVLPLEDIPEALIPESV